MVLAAGNEAFGHPGSGIVVDVGRHLNRIIQIDAAARRVRVQPGVVRNELNLVLKTHGLLFGPETSTANRAMIGGMVGIAGHLEICDDVAVTGRTAVFKSIKRPGAYSGSLWADEAKHFHRNAARFNRLEELARRVRRLEGATGATGGGDGDE